jgi:hypothetical protein
MTYPTSVSLIRQMHFTRASLLLGTKNKTTPQRLDVNSHLSASLIARLEMRLYST